MPLFQTPDFNDRRTAAIEAKKALLAKMVSKPAVQAENFVSREEEKATKVEALRAARAAEKETARLAKIEAERVAAEALLNNEEAQLELKRNERKERKAAVKAEARAKREAKSAMRRG